LPNALTGRCYCGGVSIKASAPQTVAYCHCEDCRRWTGAPLPAFAAVTGDIVMTPEPAARSFAKGVTRWSCPDCGSPLAAQFDYLPGQTYLPLGILDQADELPPQIHAHSEAQLAWLHIKDDLPRTVGSARCMLNEASV